MYKCCCLCGKVFDGFGNNPWPIVNDGSKCCNKCNDKYVLYARVIGMDAINPKNVDAFKTLVDYFYKKEGK